MNVIICKNYEEVSEKAAEIFKEQINNKPNSVLGLATGSTPEGMYSRLVDMYNNGEVDFDRVTTFNLDEYYPIAQSDEQSYHTFMNRNLFSKINVDSSRIHIPNGETTNPVEECESYERVIKECGGVDLQILGIGRNGHIGFNEPGMRLNTKTHITALTQDTIDANARFFESSDMVPTHAITMGISTIMASKKIILLATGSAKHNAVKELLSTDITTDNPATMLKIHPDFTLICDRAAYSDIHIGVDIGGMSIKIGVVDNNEIIDRRNIKVNDTHTAEDITDAIASSYNELSEVYDVRSIGIGTPGIIRNGAVSAVNLPFDNFRLEEELKKRIDIPVSVENDASCAAFGEQLAGAGNGAKNMLLITLGTGIGAGIIIDGKIYSGCGAAGEAGHMCIDIEGLECSCGQRGCWERYASVTALKQQTTAAAAENPDSILAKICGDEVSGKSVFIAALQGCETAKAVLNRYFDYLAAGLKTLINIFDPEAILISGGLSNEGDNLINPLKERLAPFKSVRTASLKNDAGIIGAAALVLYRD